MTANFDVSTDAYERFEARSGLFGRLTGLLADLSGASAGRRVLDVGCGCGHSLAVLAERCGRRGFVVGLDRSAAMLERVPAVAGAGVCGLVRADGGGLSCFVPACFDVVLYNASAFLLPDPGASFRAARRLLRSGGSVGVSVLRGLVDARTGEDLVERASRETSLRPGTGGIVEPAALPGLLGREVGPVRSTVLQHEREHEPRLFYMVPAQSAALFPRRPVAERLDLVAALFDHLDAAGARPALEWELLAARADGGP